MALQVKVVEVPVERLIETVKEVPQVTEREVPVERIIERIKEYPVETIKEVPVDKVPLDRVHRRQGPGRPRVALSGPWAPLPRPPPVPPKKLDGLTHAHCVDLSVFLSGPPAPLKGLQSDGA